MLVADIDVNGDGTVPGAADVGRGFGRAIHIEIGSDDRRRRLRQTPCDGMANAAGGSGNDGNMGR